MLWSWSSERFWQSHFHDLCPFRAKYEETDLGTSFPSAKRFYGIQVAKARKSRSNCIKINRTFRLTFFNHIDIILLCVYEGTGKTVTGVHIAYWFTERNKRLVPFKNLEKRAAGENDCEETGPKAPAQVIYCGPSNKAVDVVTGKAC